MKKTAATVLPAVILGIAATLTSCNSSTPKPTGPDAYVIKVDYLEPLGYYGRANSVFNNQYPHFTPGQSSNAKLIAAGKEACRDLQTHKPAEAWVLLKRDGWTGPEADLLLFNAARSDMFCPDQNQVVDAWFVANPTIRPTSPFGGR